MSEVGIAAWTKQFDAVHTVTGIHTLGHFGAIEFTMETRPAATRVKLALRPEQRVSTADALISTGFGMITIAATERCLCTGLPGHTVLFRVKLLLPLLLGSGDFFHDDPIVMYPVGMTSLVRMVNDERLFSEI